MTEAGSHIAAHRGISLHRAPLAGVAAAVATGITLGRFLALPTSFWAIAAGAAGVAAIVTFRRPHLHLLTAALAAGTIAALGAIHLRLNYYHVAENHVVTYADTSATLATIRGRIVTAPKTFDAGAGVRFGYRFGPRTTMLLAAGSIRTGAGWLPTSGLVRVTIKEPADFLAPGQEVELMGRLSRPHPPENPGQFDWAAAARADHVLAHATAESADAARVLAAADRPWPIRMFWRLRAAARQHLSLCGQPRESSLLSALLVGERDPALRTLNRAMVRAGAAHFLSISGLHLGVFLGFVFLLCRLVLSPRRAAGVVLIVLTAYVLLAEPRAPLLRSALMAAGLCIATIAHKRHASLNALALAALVLLAIDPLQLFSAPFQLSFTIVAGIILFNRRVAEMLFGRWRRTRGLMVFRRDQRVRRWLNYTLANWLFRAIAMALTAYVVAAPLVAYHFGLFCPYGPVLSLLLLPLVMAVLIPGYVAIALAWPMPNLSHAVGSLAAGAAEGLAAVVEALQHLPGMSFELYPVHPAAVGLCYVAMLTVLGRRRLRRGRLWAAASVAAAAAALTITQLPARAPRSAELDLLAVGNGQCAVLRAPGGQTVLIDAGTQGGFEPFEQVLAPFLRARNLPRPTAAFVSHANSDHYNALPALMKHHRPHEAYVSEYFGRPMGGRAVPEAEAQFAQRLAAGCDRVIRLRPGDGRRTVRLDERTHVEVLWPPSGRNDLDVNDTSLVLRVTCDERSVLLPGDASPAAQAELAPLGPALRADVLILPHHGAWRKTLPAFVEAVDPQIVLVSSRTPPARRTEGPGADSRHAREFFLDLASRRRIYATATHGWIHLRFGRTDLSVDCMRR